MILLQTALLPFILLGLFACGYALAGTRMRAASPDQAGGESLARPRTASRHGRAGQFIRRHALWPTVLAIAWFWLNGTGLCAPLYDRLLNVAHWPPAPSRPAATIVLLGGGTELTGPRGAPRPQGDAIEKIALTARLYQEARAAAVPGRVTRVIVSGGDPQRHGVAEADNYAPDLIALGVPADAIVHERRSLNTYQNAKYVRALLPGADHDDIVLVTTAQHMRRSLLYFTRFGFVPRPVAPPPYPTRFSLLPSARNLARAAGALHELIGIAQFHVYHALRIY